MNCRVDDCDNDAARRGLCWAHVKRQQRLKDLSAPVREYGMTLREYVTKLINRAANTDSEASADRQFERALRQILDIRESRRTGQRRGARR